MPPMYDGEGEVNWLRVELKKMGITTEHIIPNDDCKPHDVGSDVSCCWCRPVESSIYSDRIMHNAMDGREEFETGERLMS